MDRMIYLSMSGAKATMQRQETLAHNLWHESPQKHYNLHGSLPCKLQQKRCGFVR